jgi:hypothetical protein
MLSLLPLACGDDRGGDDEVADTAMTAEDTDTNETGSEGESGESESESGDGDTTGSESGDGDTIGTETAEGDTTETETGDGDTTETETGDGDTTETGDGETGDPLCPLAEALVPCDADDDDPFHAIGVGCPGDAPASIPISGSVFTSPDAGAWKVAEEFGTSGDWTPHEGEKLLIISTGALPNPNMSGQVVLGEADTQIGTANGNADNVANLPNPIEPQDGSGGVPFEACDGMNDCSDTLQAQWELGESRANDLLWFRFDLEVPADANGYEFDFAFFSSEYPEWVDTMYNDVFVVWTTSETYTGNVTFIDGQPLTITALADSILYEGNDTQLDGTGFDGVGGGPMGMGMMEPIGGGTGWFTASGSAAPGETFTLAWAVFDMGDAYYDTTVVLDAFKWSCEGCIPSEVDGCGVDPQ